MHIEDFAFTPRILSESEAEAVLDIFNTTASLPIPPRTTIDEDPADFLARIREA
jgi:hypothetical protein